MLLWAELLRSVPLPTASLFPKKKDIANSLGKKCLDTSDMDTLFLSHPSENPNFSSTVALE